MLETAHFVPLENNVGGRCRTLVNVSGPQKGNILNDVQYIGNVCTVSYGNKIQDQS